MWDDEHTHFFRGIFLGLGNSSKLYLLPNLQQIQTSLGYFATWLVIWPPVCKQPTAAA